MTKDEALDLALEALEGIHPGNMTPMAEEYWNKAITAIKQARALDKKAENARELGLDYEPDYKVTVVDDQHPNGVPLEQWGRPAPVQEPVKPTAQEMQNAASNLALMREMWGEPNQPAARVNDEGFIVETGLLLSPGTLLYTIPPQRTWVSLTDDEMQDLWDRHAHMEMMRAIEAKLKEKNT
jgi:hypothetical protein